MKSAPGFFSKNLGSLRSLRICFTLRDGHIKVGPDHVFFSSRGMHAPSACACAGTMPRFASLQHLSVRSMVLVGGPKL